MVDMKAFATTHFHIPDYQVVKAVEEERELYDAKGKTQSQVEVHVIFWERVKKDTRTSLLVCAISSE